MGSSPFAKRAASARRDATLAASRSFRSNCFSSPMLGKNSCPRPRSQTSTTPGTRHLPFEQSDRRNGAILGGLGMGWTDHEEGLPPPLGARESCPPHRSGDWPSLNFDRQSLPKEKGIPEKEISTIQFPNNFQYSNTKKPNEELECLCFEAWFCDLFGNCGLEISRNQTPKLSQFQSPPAHPIVLGIGRASTLIVSLFRKRNAIPEKEISTIQFPNNFQYSNSKNQTPK
jgi:hypothetical protein